MTEPASFQVTVRPDRGGAVITVSGEIDMASIPELERAREQATATEPSRLLIDLRELRFIDSSGLKFLLECERMSREQGWRLELRRPPESAMRVFRVTGADKYLVFTDSGAP